MGNNNTGLHTAKKQQRDEFYTRYEDIAAELPRYKEQMRGKHIICPCDWDESLDEVLVYVNEEFIAGNTSSTGGSVKTIDVDKTDKKIITDTKVVKCNFVKFLLAHAEDYGIASISVSGYNPMTGEGVRFQDLDYSKYDLLITNPPFSQFTDMIKLIFENNLEFLVIGNQNAITYKECFERIMANEMWLGYGFHRNCAHFINTFYEDTATDLDHKEGMIRVSGVMWYTNLDVSYRHDEMILTEEYDPEKHPKYENYNAIEVSKTKEIPFDYSGAMGVPITFLQKYNPDQFEIIGATESEGKGFSNGLWIPESGIAQAVANGVKKYKRLFIRNKKVSHA